MYKLLIVDDESDIIDGLLSLVDWASIGVQVCDTAADGLQAQQKILEHRPEIALIDINMGKMNGLELLEWAIEENIDIKFIVLSGYDSFEYAQTAIKHGVIEYLLKPCWPEQISEAIQKAIALLQQEQSRAALMDEYRKSIGEYTQFLKGRWLARLLEQGIVRSEDVPEKIEFFQLKIPTSNLNLAVLKVNREPLDGSMGGFVDQESIRLAAMDLLRAAFEKQCPAFEIVPMDESLGIIFSGLDDNRQLEALFEQLLDEVRSLTGRTMSITVGRGGLDIAQLWAEYAHCQSVLDCDIFFDRHSVTFLDTALPKSGRQPQPYPENLESDILDCFQTGSPEVLREKVERFFSYVCGNGEGPSKEYLIRTSVLLVSRVCWSRMEAETLSGDVDLMQTEAFAQIMNAPGIDALCQAVYDFLAAIYDAEDKSKSANKIIYETKQYIKENYMKTIRLEDIVKQVYVTPCYLSNLFKRETGINLIDYLNQHRVNVAKQHLGECRLRVYEISSLVGFQDERYFTKVFKKHTGLSPKQYRDSVQ